MIHGFLDNKIVSVEEYLIDLELRKGRSVGVNHDLLTASIRFDNKEVDAFILDVIDDKLIVQLVLPLIEKFDDKSNAYKTSYIRNLINSKVFLSRFNKEFIKHIKPTEVHTEDYTTVDKLWLLSHEELCYKDTSYFEANDNCQPFDLFEHTDLRSYSLMLLKHNNQNGYSWRLRSACSSASYNGIIRYVGCVDILGIDYNIITGISTGVICPACTICCQSYV